MNDGPVGSGRPVSREHRSMTRYLAAAFVLTCAVLSTPAPVGACTCRAASSNPCAKAWAADAVFIAQVVDTSPVESTTPSGSGLAPSVSSVSSVSSVLSLPSEREMRNRMRVSERFRGDVGEQVDVYTYSGSCGFRFQEDVPYVIYAHRSADGRLSTSLCAGTHRANVDSKDLASLRAMVSAPMTSIVGEARSFANTPLEGLSVIAEADGLRYETTTGRDGQYTLPVPRGSYRVTYGVGAGLHAAEARVDVADGACVAADAHVIPDGRLTGRVVDATGTPVANMSVFLGNAQPGV